VGEGDGGGREAALCGGVLWKLAWPRPFPTGRKWWRRPPECVVPRSVLGNALGGERTGVRGRWQPWVAPASVLRICLGGVRLTSTLPGDPCSESVQDIPLSSRGSSAGNSGPSLRPSVTIYPLLPVFGWKYRGRIRLLFFFAPQLSLCRAMCLGTCMTLNLIFLPT